MSADINCCKCGCDLDQATDKGAYFTRTNPLGEIGIWRCQPSCEGTARNQDEMLIAAIEGEKP